MLGAVALQRLIELAYARRNTVRLRRLGAVEADTEGYPLYVLLPAAWLASLAIFVPAATPPYWPLIGLFALLRGVHPNTEPRHQSQGVGGLYGHQHWHVYGHTRHPDCRELAT